LRFPVGADIGFVGRISFPPLDFLPRVAMRETPTEGTMATRVTSSETTMGMCMSRPYRRSPSSGRGLEGLRHAYSPPFEGAPRIEDIAAAAGVPVLWEPFLLGPIFAEQGWNDSPFNVYPAKGRYMWRDMERLCTKYCIPFTRPSRFPRNGLLAARIASLAKATSELWLPEFTRAVFQANFAKDREIGDPAEIRSILDSLGQSGAELIEQAQAPENKLRLREQSRRAKELGIFGAPSFVVGEELFWGNDRLEDALAWAGSRMGEARR
jgi:2-hydroxychromene-2-carboxylate isomerase